MNGIRPLEGRINWTLYDASQLTSLHATHFDFERQIWIGYQDLLFLASLREVAKDIINFNNIYTLYLNVTRQTCIRYAPPLIFLGALRLQTEVSETSPMIFLDLLANSPDRTSSHENCYKKRSCKQLIIHHFRHQK